MESFLLAGVSLLILLPILYFLPLGFSLKGKVFIVMASLLIGLFGLVSVAVLPLWQTGLILVVFVIAIVYLLSKRNLDWLYITEDDVDPFELEKVEERPLPVKEMNETYSYIASSDKIPKGIISEEKIPLGGKQDSAPKPQIGLLEKLVAQNQKDLTIINKSDNFDDGENFEEVVMVDDKSNPIMPEIEEPLIAVKQPDVSDSEMLLQSEPLDHSIADDSLPEMNMVHEIPEEPADSDIEVIVQNQAEETKELESSSLQFDNSHDYLSEIEKMLDAGEQEFNDDFLVDKVQAKTPYNTELEPIPNFQLKKNETLQEEDTLAWLDNEDELEELELMEVPARKTVNLSTFMDDDEFELEELVFEDLLPNKDDQKKKEQEQAEDDRYMVKK